MAGKKKSKVDTQDSILSELNSQIEDIELLRLHSNYTAMQEQYMDAAETAKEAAEALDDSEYMDISNNLKRAAHHCKYINSNSFKSGEITCDDYITAEELGELKETEESPANPRENKTPIEQQSEITKKAIAESVKKTDKAASAAITELLNTDEFKAIKQILEESVENFKANNPDFRDRWEELQARFNEAKKLEPYMRQALENLKDSPEHPEYKEITLHNLYGVHFYADGSPLDDIGQLVYDEAVKLRNTLDYLQLFSDDSETSTDILQDVLLNSIIPEYHVMQNNALINKLESSLAINAGAFDLKVKNAEYGKNGTLKKPEVTAYTVISLDNGDNKAVSSLSEPERQVIDALCSLWEEAAKSNTLPVFTPDTVYRAMPGGGDKPSPKQRQFITDTIEKLRNLHIYIDATAEMRELGKIADNEQFILDDYCISALHGQFITKNGGQTVDGYRLNTEPLNLIYCKKTKQLATIPAEYIEIRKVKNGKPTTELIAMTANRQAMTGYLLRRIAVMKHDKAAAIEKKRAYDNRRKKNPDLEEKPLSAFSKQEHTILFNAIFDTVGISSQDRDSANRNRNFCFDVLDYEKAVGNIKGYTIQRKGRSITGIVIEI